MSWRKRGKEEVVEGLKLLVEGWLVRMVRMVRMARMITMVMMVRMAAGANTP